jgi:pimeloyl-ACP methyl ester carboxylesterase
MHARNSGVERPETFARTAPHENGLASAPAPRLAAAEAVAGRGPVSPATAGGAVGALLAGVPVRERRLDLAGVTTHVLEGGEGPPIVMLHGPGEFAARWMRVIPGLVSRHRVIAPDLPDHGESRVMEGKLDAGRVQDWLSALIEATCDSPPVLVGHLLGGAIAARYAIAQGEKLSRLVLVDSFGLARFLPSPRFAYRLIRFMMRPDDRTYDSFMTQCAVDPDRIRRDMGDRWAPFKAYNIDRARSPRVQKAMGVLMRQVGLPAIPRVELAGITVPVSLIWGRHDRANRLRIATAANERFGWPLHVIEDAADDPPVEQPGAFADALLATIAEE